MAEVRTAAGSVRGVEHGDTLAFLGIPYGTAERFRSPVPLAPWNGVLDATAYGPSCPQPAPPGAEAEAALQLFGGMVEAAESEQCLVLNVWTPATGAPARPVLVYLHGGGHAIGSGSWPVYDGAALAARDAVVITVNHRLGILGYLHVAHLLGDAHADSGVAGMADIVLALRWVRDNVAAFGGDPGNVTVFGESGGGSKVALLLAMPGAQGLFHRAVIMSGWFDLAGATIVRAETTTATLLATLGLDPGDAADLLTMPAQRLVEASAAMGGIDSGLLPVIDGRTITAQPLDAVRAGRASDIPLIIGTVRDEYSIFLPYIAMMAGGDAGAAVDTYLRARFGDHIEQVTARYEQARPELDVDGIRVAVASDGHVRMPAIGLAEAQVAAGGTVHMYRFDFVSPMAPTMGAAHGLDVPFVFGTMATAPVAGDPTAGTVLADRMGEAWVGFARSGTPSLGDGVGWPAYSSAERLTALFDVTVSVVSDPAGAERRAWSDE